MTPEEVVLLAQSAQIGILVRGANPQRDAQRLYQAIRRLGVEGLQVRMSYWPEAQLAVVNRQIGDTNATAPAIPADQTQNTDL